MDWKKYLDCWGRWIHDADLAENQELMIKHVAAISENVLNAYFDWKIRWDAHPDSLETMSLKRYHTERVAPWKATYWKTFPEGFECDYTELSTHFDLDRHREDGLSEEEEKRYQCFNEESARETRNGSFFRFALNKTPLVAGLAVFKTRIFNRLR